MEFELVMGCGLGWFVGPKFLHYNGFGWVGSVVWWVGLDWVEEIGSTDNSALSSLVHYVYSLSLGLSRSVVCFCTAYTLFCSIFYML